MQLPLPLTPDEPVRPPDPVLAFVRHRRARRYILRVLDDGSVRVTVPRWGNRREALRFVESSRGWIEGQQARCQARPRAVPGDVRVLRQQAAVELPLQMRALAARHGIEIGRITVRDQRSRWGSCTRRGSISPQLAARHRPDFVRGA
ncbi:MAG: YgjP-like metallopeptidase domain-containing protein [Vicinamibacterales bacterium]